MRHRSSRLSRAASLMAVLAGVLLAAGGGLGLAGRAASDLQPETSGMSAVRFQAVDVLVDSGGAGLAAYQVEIRAVGGSVHLVGLMGGEHSAYAEPPYYDPRALAEDQLSDRIVIAAIGQGELPTGRTRVAQLHVAVRSSGAVRYDVRVQAAGDVLGNRIDVRAHAAPAGAGGGS
jgi:hypothetical protein